MGQAIEVVDVTGLPASIITAVPEPKYWIFEQVREALIGEFSFIGGFSDDPKGWFMGEGNQGLREQRREITGAQLLRKIESSEILDEA